MKKGSVPPWLELLLATQFFTVCTVHLYPSRSECNLFCIDCHKAAPGSFCHYCRSSDHSSHRVIQVRRSTYHNVVRVAEVEDIIDVSDVQTYTINSATVVFLNERPQPKGCVTKASSTSYNCETCNRSLLDEFRFCSLGCNLKSIMDDMETTVVGENDVENTEIKQEVTACSNESANIEIASADTEIANKDEEPCEEIPPPATRVIRRRRPRKGIPQRAPFF